MDQLLPSSVFGLPVHPLVVHLTIVLVPLSAVVVLLGVWPRFRRWAGWLPVVLTGAAVVSTQLATSSGSILLRQVVASGRRNDLIAPHAEQGERLMWWVLPLFLVTAAATWTERRDRPAGHPAAPRRLGLGLTTLAALLAVGAVAQTVRTGHSGAAAAWDWLGL